MMPDVGLLRSEKTSPSMFCECILTSAFFVYSMGAPLASFLPMSPLTSAMCGSGSTFDWYAMSVNLPYSFSNGTSSMRSTSFSRLMRYWMSCATEHIFMSCFWQMMSSSGLRDMVPSSFMISMIAAPGFSPASLQRSTEPSVCPARTRTPPGFALRGCMCPGLARSIGFVVGSIATLIVLARSCAETPVVMPYLSSASIVSVYAVPRNVVLTADCCGSSSFSQMVASRARQSMPLPTFSMKLIVSGVTNSAAQTKSPSFSRSSSSTRMIILPSFRSSIISGIVFI